MVNVVLAIVANFLKHGFLFMLLDEMLATTCWDNYAILLASQTLDVGRFIDKNFDFMLFFLFSKRILKSFDRRLKDMGKFCVTSTGSIFFKTQNIDLAVPEEGFDTVSESGL